ncbi:MAG: 4'-phosphopantetheinyl transferase superfamily protein [Bacillota bacterium]|nr:4'-phosphopantetheinyl transferase superfamily protein [Bacillota bacterium]
MKTGGEEDTGSCCDFVLTKRISQINAILYCRQKEEMFRGIKCMKLYISDIRGLFDLPGISLLDAKRQDRVYRYRRLEDRVRCLTAGLMLQSVFGEDAVSSMTVSSFGKPILPNGPCFNLSHSGNMVVLLADEQPVGVDVELITPYSQTVAKKVFTAVEQSWLSRQATDEAFFRLWTGKEAIMKALGLGFHLPPERFEIRPEEGFANIVGGQSWYLHWLALDAHIICTAAEHPGRAEMPVWLSRNELLSR